MVQHVLFDGDQFFEVLVDSVKVVELVSLFNHVLESLDRAVVLIAGLQSIESVLRGLLGGVLG